MRINGMEVVDFLSYFGDKYIYSSKSTHARINSILNGDIYDMGLHIYNIIEKLDELLII